MDQRRAILSPNAFDDQNEITRRMFLILLLTVWVVVFALTIFDLVLGDYPPVISHGLGLFVLSPLAYILTATAIMSLAPDGLVAKWRTAAECTLGILVSKCGSQGKR